MEDRWEAVEVVEAGEFIGKRAAAVVAGDKATDVGEWTDNREAAVTGEAAVDVGDAE